MRKTTNIRQVVTLSIEVTRRTEYSDDSGQLQCDQFTTRSNEDHCVPLDVNLQTADCEALQAEIKAVVAELMEKRLARLNAKM